MVPPRRLWQFRGICRAEGSVERVEGSERASSALWERRLCARATGSYRDHQREFWGVFLGESEESERVLPRSRSEVSREFSQVERSEQLGPTAFTEEVSFRKFFPCIERSRNAVESVRERPGPAAFTSEVSRGKSRAIAVPEANTTHQGLGRSPRQTIPRTLCAHFAASVRASPHDRRPDPFFEMQAAERWKLRAVRARFSAAQCAPRTLGSGADVRARARH